MLSEASEIWGSITNEKRIHEMTNEMLGKYPQLTGLAKFILLTNAKAKLIAQHYYTLKSGLSGQFFPNQFLNHNFKKLISC